MINDVVKEIRDLLETQMTTRCVAYYVGNVGFTAQAHMPCLMVRRRKTRVERPNTAKNQYRYSISILVVTSRIKSFDQDGITDHIIASEKLLGEIMEEKDTDGAPKTNTVLGCLMQQSNLRGTNYVYSIDPEVNYEVESPPGFFYVAAEVTIDIISDFILRKA